MPVYHLVIKEILAALRMRDVTASRYIPHSLGSRISRASRVCLYLRACVREEMTR